MANGQWKMVVNGCNAAHAHAPQGPYLRENPQVLAVLDEEGVEFTRVDFSQDGFADEFAAIVPVQRFIEARELVGVMGERGDVMRDHHDGQFVKRTQFLQHCEKLRLAAGVEAAGRFVEEQQARAGNEGSGDGQTLLLATGKIAGGAVFEAFQTDMIERFESGSVLGFPGRLNRPSVAYVPISATSKTVAGNWREIATSCGT